MIELKVTEYCQNCPEFDAEIKRDTEYVYSISSDREVCMCNTTITCKHKERCEAIRKHLMKNWEI